MKKRVSEMLYGLAQDRNVDKVTVLTEDPIRMISHNRKAMTNLCTLLALLIISVWFLVHFAIFLVKDVIMYQKDIQVNETGAFMQSKSSESEHAMYLFTTSEVWANTGIQLHAGDRIMMSASGAFNTSIRSVYDGAIRNELPEYPWIMVGGRNDMASSEWTNNINLTLYPVTHFGAVLYQIRSDADPCRSDWTEIIAEPLDTALLQDKAFRQKWRDSLENKLGIYELTTFDDYIDVKKDGTLHVAVNDIYLNDAVIRKYENDNRAKAARLMNDSVLTVYDDGKNVTVDKDFRDLFSLFYYPEVDSIHNGSVVFIAGEKFTDHFRDNREAWFNDNVGQIALTANIQHRIPDWAVKQVSWYRSIENQVLNIKNNPWNILWLLLEFLIVIPAIFFAGYAILTFVIYWMINIAIRIWEVISSHYIKWSKVLIHRPSK